MSPSITDAGFKSVSVKATGALMMRVLSKLHADRQDLASVVCY